MKSRSSIVGHAVQAPSSCREPPTWARRAAWRMLHRLQVNDRTPMFNGQPSLPCRIILLAINTINVMPASFRCNLAAITISTFCPCICAYRPDHHLCSIWCASACLRQAAKAGHAPAVHLLAVLKSSKQATSSFTWKQTRTMRVYTQASKSPHAQQQQATSLPWPRTSRWRRPEVQYDVFTVCHRSFNLRRFFVLSPIRVVPVALVS